VTVTKEDLRQLARDEIISTEQARHIKTIWFAGGREAKVGGYFDEAIRVGTEQAPPHPCAGVALRAVLFSCVKGLR